MKITKAKKQVINALNTFAMQWFVLGQLRADPTLTIVEGIQNFAHANHERLTPDGIRSYEASFCRFRNELKNITT